MEELYREYGELMVQREMIEGRINAVRAKMAEQLNKQPQTNEPEEKEA